MLTVYKESAKIHLRHWGEDVLYDVSVDVYGVNWERYIFFNAVNQVGTEEEVATNLAAPFIFQDIWHV